MSRSRPCFWKMPCWRPSSGIAPSQLPRCGEAILSRSAAAAGDASARQMIVARMERSEMRDQRPGCRGACPRARRRRDPGAPSELRTETTSIIMYPQLLQGGAPARGLAAHEDRHLLRRAGADIAAARLGFLLHRRIVEDAHDRAVELVDDRP